MLKEETYHIEDFISELSSFSFSDVLVNLNHENKAIYKIDYHFQQEQIFPFSNQFNQIYKIAVQYKKTSDIQSLCLANTLISWKIKDRLIQTPLFLIPTHCTWNKIKQEFKIDFQEENLLVNPFVTHILKQEFDLEMIIDFDLSLQEIKYEIEQFLSKNEITFSFTDFSAVGNFHYHRYEIVRDLEEIRDSKQENPLIQQILGEVQSKDFQKLELSSKNTFESDSDQGKIFKEFANENIVVQGPPGTGKTQVLSNLLSKLLLHPKRQLLVSEKKTALDVVEKKLKSRNLDHFVFVSHSQTKASDFVSKLKNTWKFLEEFQTEKKLNLELSSQYLQQIQMKFDKLNQTNFWALYHFHEVQEFAKSAEFQKLIYIQNLPTLQEWESISETVGAIYTKVKNTEILGKIKQSILKQEIFLDERIRQISKDLTFLNVAFSAQSLTDLRKLSRKTIQIQILENEEAKKYFDLIVSEKKWKNFQSLCKKYKTLTLESEGFTNDIKQWKIIPSETQIQNWLNQGKNSSWFSKRKMRNEIKRFLKIPFAIDSTLVENTLAYLKNQKELLGLRLKFNDLGIENPELEISVINYVYFEYQKIDKIDLQELEVLNKKERDLLSKNSSLIKKLIEELDTNFKLNEAENLLSLFTILEDNLHEIIENKSHLLKLEKPTYECLYLAKNENDLEKIVLKSNWVLFSSLNPDLAEFTGDKLKKILNQIEKEEAIENKLFSEEIIIYRKELFQKYHHILQTSSTKLVAEKRELKKELKAGKAILVKEFSKSKQHKSIRELMKGDARHWLDVLLPIHLCTPTFLSKNIPLEQNFYECVIFDEASQLPLAKAISCLFRAERILIAGDSQQMSPSSFFSSMKTGVDLLHQASYYLRQMSLKHHYRSKYAELVSFSNKHFYNNELIVYPSSYDAEKPVQWHFIESGVFDERQNLIEAKAVAKLIEKEIYNSKSIGVVAFSEHQLSCIWKEINVNNYVLLEKKIKNNTLFFKALEQVQGEECDTLIISMGYGKNKQGEFHHRFGPLNQKNGTKRLNVLFTRAIEQIHFFSSVKAGDFQLSNNEAINLLRLYLSQIESSNEAKAIHLPFDLKTKIDAQKMSISFIHRQISDAEELKTFHQVMQKRAWELNYEL